MNRVFVLLWLIIGCSYQQKPDDLQNPFKRQEAVVQFEHDILEEASGLESSYRNPNHFWSHNDSGGEPTVYLFNEAGEVVLSVGLEGLENKDWEEIVTVEIDSVPYIFVADFGDNKAVRDEVSILKFQEPVFSEEDAIRIPQNEVSVMRFRYAEGPRDAEALMFDSSTKEFVLVTKREKQSLVYGFPFESKKEVVTIASVGTLPERNFTAADANENGEVLIKSYHQIYFFPASEVPVIKRMLEWNPTPITYQPEPQGEAICWSGEDFYTLSEKKGVQELLLFERKK